MNAKKIRAIARDEIERWNQLGNRPLVTAIIFCICHRLITGETFEETFCKPGVCEPGNDYQI